MLNNTLSQTYHDRRACDILHDRYLYDVPATRIAKVYNISRQRLYRFFNANEKFIEYLTVNKTQLLANRKRFSDNSDKSTVTL